MIPEFEAAIRRVADRCETLRWPDSTPWALAFDRLMAARRRWYAQHPDVAPRGIFTEWSARRRH